MSKLKDAYIAAHEDLITAYLTANPNATDDEAYEATAPAAYEHMQDQLEDVADRKCDEWKDRRIEDEAS